MNISHDINVSDGGVRIKIETGGYEKEYRFKVEEILSLPLTSLISLRFEYAYLRDIILMERNRIEYYSKKRKAEAIKELVLSGKTKTSAVEEAVADKVYEALIEKLEEFNFYYMLLNDIIKTIDTVIYTMYTKNGVQEGTI